MIQHAKSSLRQSQPITYPHGAEVSYQCGPGWTMVGNSKTTCTNGVWAPLPSCRQNNLEKEPTFTVQLVGKRGRTPFTPSTKAHQMETSVTTAAPTQRTGEQLNACTYIIPTVSSLLYSLIKLNIFTLYKCSDCAKEENPIKTS